MLKMSRLFVGLFIFVIGVNYSQAEVVNIDTELKKESRSKRDCPGVSKSAY